MPKNKFIFWLIILPLICATDAYSSKLEDKKSKPIEQVEQISIIDLKKSIIDEVENYSNYYAKKIKTCVEKKHDRETLITIFECAKNFKGLTESCQNIITSCTQETDEPPVKPPSPVTTQSQLTINTEGQGRVTTQEGIDCPNHCSGTYKKGTELVLTAHAHVGYHLQKWINCDKPNKNDCHITLNKSLNIVAFFQENPQLEINIFGHGIVKNKDSQCPEMCKQHYQINKDIELTAVPAKGYRFLKWENCQKTQKNTCVFNSNNNITINAYFKAKEQKQQLALTVETDGNGTIEGIGTPCKKCTRYYPVGTQLSLQAKAENNNKFSHWIGCENNKSNNPNCTMKIDQSLKVTAIFVEKTPGCPQNMQYIPELKAKQIKIPMILSGWQNHKLEQGKPIPAFCIDKRERTVKDFKQAPYKTFVHADSINLERQKNDDPVQLVSHTQSNSYIHWLNNKSNSDYALPTLQQWYVAIIYTQSKQQQKYNIGTGKLNQRQANSTNTYDLIGNLKEWSNTSCAKGKYYTLGQDYTNQSNMLPAIECTEDLSYRLGFRLVHPPINK